MRFAQNHRLYALATLVIGALLISTPSALVAATDAPIATTVIYVDPLAAGDNDGSSWTDAFTSLRRGLRAAQNNQPAAVWVAGGVYRPDNTYTLGTQTVGSSGSPRAFVLRDQVTVIGGFAGESDPADRAPSNQPTVISGANGTQPAFSRLVTMWENSNLCDVTLSGAVATGKTKPIIIKPKSGTAQLINCTVENITSETGAIFILGGTTELSQCLITNNQSTGNAGGLYIRGRATVYATDSAFDTNSALLAGGSVYVTGRSHLITDGSLFTNNVANDGAGLFLFKHADLTATTCIFDNNVTTGGFGGAIEAGYFSEVTLTNSDFSNNAANEGGDLRLLRRGKLAINDCTFTNSAATYGGALYLWNVSSAQINDSSFVNAWADQAAAAMVNNGSAVFDNCTFTNGWAEYGGGAIEVFNKGDMTAKNCLFDTNVAWADSGGAVAVWGVGEANLGNCILTNNDSYLGGAVVTFNRAKGNAVNSVFANNTAFFGGAWYSEQRTKDSLIHCTLVGNSASEAGNSLYVAEVSRINVTSTILWPSTLPAVASFDNANKVAVKHSNIRGSGGSSAWDASQGNDKGDNLDLDPAFVDVSMPQDGGLALLPSSPLVDVGEKNLPKDSYDLDNDGNTNENLPVDLDGNDRDLGADPDIGAYELLVGGG